MQVHALPRQLQRAAQTREQAAEEEHAGEHHALVDAERADHLAVLGRGADQRAPAGAVEQQPQQAEHHRADADQEQLIEREAQPEDVGAAAQPGRAWAQQVLRAPGHQRQVLHDQHHAEGRQQLEQLRRAIDAAQQQHLHHQPDQPDQQGGAEHPAPEAEMRRAAAW